VVLSCALVAAAATAYCAACAPAAISKPPGGCWLTHLPSFAASLSQSLLTVLSAVLVDYLLLGVVLATSGWRVRGAARVRGKLMRRAWQAAVEPIPAHDGHAQPLGGAAGGVVRPAAAAAADGADGRTRLYAFDVHCNAYLPLFMLLYGASPLP